MGDGPRTARQMIERADMLLSEADTLIAGTPPEELNTMWSAYANNKMTVARALTQAASVMLDVERTEAGLDRVMTAE